MISFIFIIIWNVIIYSVTNGKCSLKGAPGRMGQQGEPGIAGYEVITGITVF